MNLTVDGGQTLAIAFQAAAVLLMTVSVSILTKAAALMQAATDAHRALQTSIEALHDVLRDIRAEHRDDPAPV